MSLEDFTMYGGAFGNKQDSVFPNLEVRWRHWLNHKLFIMLIKFKVPVCSKRHRATDSDWMKLLCLSLADVLSLTGGSDVLVIPSRLACRVLACLQCRDWPAAGPIRNLPSVHGPWDSESAETQRLLPGPAGVQAAVRHRVGLPEFTILFTLVPFTDFLPHIMSLDRRGWKLEPDLRHKTTKAFCCLNEFWFMNW